MVFALTPVQSAFATHGEGEGARDIQEAGDVCENADGDAFDDITNERIDAAADCLNDLNIARGFGDNEYRPSAPVSREQMASFISRKLESANEYDRPDDAPEADFTDRDKIAQVHVNNVDILASVGITEGKDDGSFDPGGSVTRAQMAAFIVRQIEEITGETLTAQEDHFDDDDNTWSEENINILADLGIVEGVEGGGFNPSGTVTRGQMALFLARDVDALNNEYGITFDVVVEQNEVIITSDRTVAAGDEVTGTIGGNPTDVTVSGCGLTDEALTDEDTAAEDFQFSFTIPSNQAAGECTLTFSFTDEDGNEQSVDVTIEVTEPAGNQTATVRPELTSARIVSTTTTTQATASNPAGTVVEYTFDENVDLFAPVPGEFHVYDQANNQYNGDTVVSRSGNSVQIRFSDADDDSNAVGGDVDQDELNTAAQAAELTLATVDLGAVRDNDGVTNPEGDAPIGTQGSTTAGTAGVTEAPDLVSVGNFREAQRDADDRAVDFTFDEAAYVVDDAGFSLVRIDGSEVDCVGPAPGSTTPGSGGTVAGGNGTTTITVICGDGTAAGTPTATNTARGTVDANTVSDDADDFDCTPGDTSGTTTQCEGNLNPLQAADVSNNGNTADPDLVSAEFRPSSDTGDDQVLYTFDENVNTTTVNATLFNVYDIDGNETAGKTGEFAVNTTDNRQVLVDFPDGTLADAVGANVEDGAVIAADNGVANEQDEVGVTNQQTSTRTPGETAGPQLVSVALSQGTDQFGNTTDYRATYTFDEDVDLNTVGDFYLYAADGTRYFATACTDGQATTTQDDDRQVTCTAYDIAGGTTDATSAQIGAAVLGTVDDGAVTEEGAGGLENPEGAEVTTGGTGTPRN